jgi:hypothetical protein
MARSDLGVQLRKNTNGCGVCQAAFDKRSGDDLAAFGLTGKRTFVDGI